MNWLKSRTKQIGQILHQQPDIFFIEYFPYHSTKGFDFPEDLPSYQFTNILIEKAMNEGKAILMISEELPELLGMSDRVLIMKDGEITKEFNRSKDLSEADVIGYMI